MSTEASVARERQNKTNFSYLETSRVFFLDKSSNRRLCSATGQSKLNAVEWISLARQSHHVQLPAKVLLSLANFQ